MSTSRADPDRLWVPLLTHYRRTAAAVEADPDRIGAHLAFIRPSVRQFLIAGSTGDGWEMSFETLLDLVRLTRRDLFQGTRLLFGALRPTTDGVIAWARRFETNLDQEGGVAGDYVGLAVCPPVDPQADQAAILAHFERVLDETRSPIAIYQLPQVTGCSIEPDTMRVLARQPRVLMFKDTSGTDAVAAAGFTGATLVRGAEGDYLGSLAPAGSYDGWLLSTGNALGTILRRILERHGRDEHAQALRLSKALAILVEMLFAAAASVPFGNAFSNANRAVDHLWAHGREWPPRPPPLTASGNELPDDLLVAADLVGHFPALPECGYRS
ncbi:MAG: dihydrodipicolinate synthase family protein [Microvirga sp.]